MTGRFFTTYFLTLALMVFSCGRPVVAEEEFSPDQIAFFENRIRPLFVNHCQSCHGSAKSESDFRVDSRSAIMRGGASERPAAIAGDAAASLLMAVVSYESDYDMPPDGKLSQQEIADLARWVDEGLAWPSGDAQSAEGTISDRIEFQRANHWSFQPIKAPPVPSLASGSKRPHPVGPVASSTTVDAFLLEKLSEKGLGFSPAADKTTLIRRASFDLTGLPPTYEEVKSFVADEDPDAYEKLIDRLLASPRYGQRWARHWLDVARYADTLGYALDNVSRDYPFAYTYRDYVIDALNRDLPYNDFLRQQLAADQLTDDPMDRSLAALGFLTVGRKYLERPDVIDDRIDVVTRGLMGLTVACARCHDHKFDGVATEDYYALYGVLNNCFLPEELPMIGQPPASANKFVAELGKLNDDVEALQKKARDTTRRHLLEHIDQYAASAWLSESEDQLREAGVITLPTDQFRGKYRQEWVEYWRSVPENVWVSKTLAGLDKAASFDDRRAVAERFAAALKQAAVEYLEAASPPDPLVGLFSAVDQRRAAAVLIFHVNAPYQFPFHRMRKLIKREDLLAIRKLKAAVIAHNTKSPRGFDRAMVVKDRKQIEEPYVMIRGNVDRRGKTVPRRFPELLARQQKDYSQRCKGAGRLELANDIVSPDNPLTARVIVNRVWMHHFIKPLVGTTSDFGIQGDRPSHPDLLDWLAADFMATGWSLKSLHRKMMLSRAYRQSSRSHSKGEQADVENKWLWRMNRRRLEVEALRDSILFAAGTLDESLSGRGVKQFEPPFDTRRTIYGIVDRQGLADELRMFDFASPDQSTPKRTRTNVPQQSLFLMNSPLVAEQSDALTARAEALMGRRKTNDAAFVDQLFRLVLSRDPLVAERRALFEYIKSADQDGRRRAGHLMLMMNEFEMVD